MESPLKAVLLASVTALALGGAATAALAATNAAGNADAAPAVQPANVLTAEWTGPYAGVPPFDKVTPEVFPAALQAGIDEQRREVMALANNPAAPTF